MIPRTLQETVKELSKSFPVLLITGPRQVGKTTLLELCATKKRGYVTLDDLEERELAQNDPAGFLQKHPCPVTIDEIQYAPELFIYIKIAVDKAKKPGMFWLTGSQKFSLMKGVSESLAGRIAIIDMLGLSQAERDGRPKGTSPYIPTQTWIKDTRKHTKSPKNLRDVYQDIWQGSYPAVIKANELSRDAFYNAYIQTYIQRDVKDILSISDDITFTKFLRAIAARTGQLLNFSDIARDVDIDHKTAKSWLSILETSGLVYLLQPYFNNITKRMVKTPKLYFLDTGLCSYLTQWPSPESLEAGAMSGAIFETYIISEILKSYWHNGKTPFLYYYRDADQKEVDLIIEQAGKLYPTEIKKTATPSKSASKNFHTLSKLGKEIGHGGVICLREKDIPLSQEVDAIPVGYL